MTDITDATLSEALKPITGRAKRSVAGMRRAGRTCAFDGCDRALNPCTKGDLCNVHNPGGTKKVRPIRIDGDIAYVTLTKGYVAVIDAADVPLVEGRNWGARLDKNTVYARRTDTSGPAPRTVLLHRMLLGEPKGFQVDHKDGDGLNNRRSNLRVATNQQNASNARLSRLNTSGFKGVSWHKQRRKWYARIRKDGRSVHLGMHHTPEDAHAAYAAASADLHGPFGRVA
jgi:hypothetical protein